MLVNNGLSVTDRRAELEAEQRRLAYVRECLTESQAEALRTAEGAADRGDEDAAYWYYRRAWQLEDRETSPLFFGRLDGPEPEPIYIGRRYVSDTNSTPVTIDWRTPMAARFYRASHSQPMEVTRRRRYGFSADDELTGFDDEVLAGMSDDHELSALVKEEIERAHYGPMRDIVATIQPDQDHIIRLGTQDVLVVQGGPGTGKTAVGLHRAAYLLFEHRRVRDQGVLVIGPNDTFVHYISRVLPALGEMETNHASLPGLVGAERARPDDPAAAVVKGDARMAAVLERAVWRTVSLPDEDLVIKQTSPYVRLTAHDLRDVATELIVERLRFADAREAMTERIARAARRQVERHGQTLSDGETRKVRRAKQTKALVEAIWPQLEPKDVLFQLYADAEFLAACAQGLLTEDEQAAIRWATPPATPGRAKWTEADHVLLDELTAHLSDERRFGHVVVDEAQDLSAMQWRAVARRCAGTATLLGDLAQQTARWATPSWQDALAALRLPGKVARLNTSFRVPQEILDLANRLLRQIAPDLPATTSVRSTRQAVTVVPVPGGSGLRTIAERVGAIVRALPVEEGSVGVITADPDVDEMRASLAAVAVLPVDADEIDQHNRVALVPVGRAKGLEFDHVVIVEPRRIVEQAPNGIRLLYIALTRTISRLTIVHRHDLPEALGL